MLEKQLKELTLNNPIVINSKKNTICNLAEKMNINVDVHRIKNNQCVVTLIEGVIDNVKNDLFDILDFSNPFETIEYNDATPEYVRSLVNSYNKQNSRYFKVSSKGGNITITEPFESIKQIPSLQADVWRSAFENELVKKLV